MAPVMLTCPRTGREFSAGILTTQESLNRAGNTFAAAFCPYCLVEHRCRMQDARLVQAIPPAQWVENNRDNMPR
jgi:hypothetical protein